MSKRQSLDCNVILKNSCNFSKLKTSEMIKKVLVLVFCLLIDTISYCQSIQMSNNRPDYKIQLAVDDYMAYESTIKGSKYIIIDSVIQIFPGEKLYVESEILNNKVKSFRTVPEIQDTSKTLVIEFLQEVQGKKHEQMILMVYNPLNMDISYDALTEVMINKQGVFTSNIPVLARSKSYKKWPDIINSAILYSFKLKESGTTQ
jgi:hypothetical protein